VGNGVEADHGTAERAPVSGWFALVPTPRL